MKEKEEKYLNAIYQNIRTTIQSIEDIMPKSTDENLTSELSKEQDEYNCLAKECEAFAKAEKIEGLKDNNFIVNDPNSRENSQRQWSYERLSWQIKAMWSYSLL